MELIGIEEPNKVATSCQKLTILSIRSSYPFLFSSIFTPFISLFKVFSVRFSIPNESLCMLTMCFCTSHGIYSSPVVLFMALNVIAYS